MEVTEHCSTCIIDEGILITACMWYPHRAALMSTSDSQDIESFITPFTMGIDLHSRGHVVW
jgi:hypothetical protein